MNIRAGFKTIWKYPLIVLFPVVLQVLLSFFISITALLGINFEVHFGSSPAENLDFQLQFNLPVYIPALEDVNQPTTFLTATVDDLDEFSFPILIIGTILYQVVAGFAISMFLGSIKKVLIKDSHNNQSPITLGRYHFWRIFLFQLLSLLILGVTLLLGFIFIPLGLVGFFLYIIIILTPYIIVLEDKSLGEAITDSTRFCSSKKQVEYWNGRKWRLLQSGIYRSSHPSRG